MTDNENQPEGQPEPTTIPPSLIANEAEFCRALGINPDNVVTQTVKVEFRENVPHVRFEAIHPVPPDALGRAFLAASSGQPTGPVGVPAPQDHQPPGPRRAAARKRTTAKKATSKPKATS